MDAQTYVAVIAALIALLTGVAQWRASGKQQALQNEQQRMSLEQQGLQRQLAAIETERFRYEQERLRSAQVVLSVGPIRAEVKADMWIALHNIGEAPARQVTLELKIVKTAVKDPANVLHIRSESELPIVALGPGQAYPLLLRWSGFFVAIATIGWTDERGSHELEFQVSNAGRFADLPLS